MSIPTRLAHYLDQHGARYDVCAHAWSRSSAETARTAHVPLHQLAKSVLLEDDDGCVMAVVPADRQVHVGKVARLLGRHELHLADENRIAALFDDCDRGAMPALGMAWGVDTVVDDALDDNDVVFVEAGDHERLLKLSRGQFEALMRDARRGRFSQMPTH